MALSLKANEDWDFKAKEARPFVEGGTQHIPAGQSSVGRQRRVLVVDDNPIVCRAFEVRLRARGFVVTSACEPGAAATAVEKERVQLVILDLNFDVLKQFNSGNWSGVAALQWVKRLPELAGIPVIVVTGRDSPNCREESLAAGAAAFFQKPVDCNELVNEMVRVLEDGCGEAPHEQ
jgi:CheY-like chemotaxis protein